MGNTLTECAAVDETVVFLNYFKDLLDPRQQGKVCHPLEEILLLCLLAVVAGAETRSLVGSFHHGMGFAGAPTVAMAFPPLRIRSLFRALHAGRAPMRGIVYSFLPPSMS